MEYLKKREHRAVTGALTETLDTSYFDRGTDLVNSHTHTTYLDSRTHINRHTWCPAQGRWRGKINKERVDVDVAAVALADRPWE